MAETVHSRLIYKLQTVEPRKLNALMQLGDDLASLLGHAPFHTVQESNPAVSLDAALLLAKSILQPAYPHLSLALSGMANPPHELWRAEIATPEGKYHGKGKSPAVALCVALLRTVEGQ